MGALLDRMNRSDAGFVWLDHDDYAVALLGGGASPWSDVAAVVSLQASALRLLGSDAVAFSLTRVGADWLHMHADLRAAIGARRRISFPLKTLLEDEALRAHAVELANALRASQPTRPLALVLPSPRRWLALAYAQAFPDEMIEIDADDADSASVRVADFLRSFANSGVDALLLEEAPDVASIRAEDIECYRSVLNVAANYRWDVGLRIAGVTDPQATAALDYVISSQSAESSRGVLEIGAEFWTASQAPPLPAAHARYGALPANAQPEVVLQRLAMLRQATPSRAA